MKTDRKMTASTLLTDDELKELTGSAQKSKQCKILSGYGVKFFTRPDGKPVVPVSALSDNVHQLSPQTEQNDGFNL